MWRGPLKLGTQKKTLQPTRQASLTWPDSSNIEEMRRRLGLVMQAQSGASKLTRFTESLALTLATLDAEDSDSQEALSLMAATCLEIVGLDVAEAAATQARQLWEKMRGLMPEILRQSVAKMEVTLQAMQALGKVVNVEEKEVQLCLRILEGLVDLQKAYLDITDDAVQAPWLDDPVLKEKLSAVIIALSKVGPAEPSQWCSAIQESMRRDANARVEAIQNAVLEASKGDVMAKTVELREVSGCAGEGADWDAAINYEAVSWDDFSAQAATSLMVFDVKGMVELLPGLERVPVDTSKL